MDPMQPNSAGVWERTFPTSAMGETQLPVRLFDLLTRKRKLPKAEMDQRNQQSLDRRANRPISAASLQ